MSVLICFLLFVGQRFALLSGTSMATPHVVGTAALIKQRNPSWTPSMIASALATTATNYDSFGDVIMAEGSDFSLVPSTPFDFGAGHIIPTRAIDPGLVFPSGNNSSVTEYHSRYCVYPNGLTLVIAIFEQ